MLPSAYVYGLDISQVPEGTRKIAHKNVTWAIENIIDAGQAEADKRVDV